MGHGRKDETIRVSSTEKIVAEEPNYNVPRSDEDVIAEFVERADRGGETMFPADLLRHAVEALDPKFEMRSRWMSDDEVKDAKERRKEMKGTLAARKKEIKIRQDEAKDIHEMHDEVAAAKATVGVGNSPVAAPAQSVDDAASEEQASAHLSKK